MTKGQMGGKRPGAGRPVGSKNKTSKEVAELARVYGPDAIELLWRIAKRTSAPESSRVMAIRELLDRGYGKAKQPITGGEAEDLPVIIERVTRTIIDPKDD